MKKFLVLFVILLFSSIAFAQDAAQDDPKLPMLSAFMKINSLEADFVQENYYPGVDSYSYKGKVYIKRGYKAIWDYEEPDEYYLLESGSVTHYSAELKQAVKMYVDMSRFEDPSVMLLGLMLNVRNVTDTFDVVEEGSLITLTPKNKMGLENIQIVVKNGQFSEISSADASGNRINIKFSNIKQNKAINDSVFLRALPQGTAFIEQ
ncbi:MAG: outer-membrane lipoprotein carrier protein LolA [Deferribacteraceae bacterium]|jgi:chaperone LolA|nr:outer-membrane lipoprotein carrier protein LolA [Deferribacteraceae bacterium]